MKQTQDAAAFGFGGLSPNARRTLRKFKHRRKVADGYPWEGKFETAEEIAQYFSGDKINCLVCGRSLRRLAIHLRLHDGMTEDAYRERYGLPWSRGLTSAASAEAYGDAVRERMNLELLREFASRARAMMASMPPQRRSYQPFDHRQRVERITGYQIEEQFGAVEAEEFLARMKSGRVPGDVAEDADMPSMSWVYWFMRENEEYRLRYVAAWETFPYPIQAAHGLLGERFNQELRKLFDAGMSDHKAAAILGVTAMTCNARTKAWRNR